MFVLPLKCTSTGQRTGAQRTCILPRQAWEKQRDFFLLLQILVRGTERKKKKSHFLEFVLKTHSKAMTPKVSLSGMSLPNRLSSWFAVSSHPHGGKTHQSSTTPSSWIQEHHVKFWLAGLTRNTLGKTFIERNRLWKRGLQCTYNAKDNSVGRKREPVTSV